MATGLSCIVTAHGGIPEAVTHMKSGILVGESDPEGINRWLERPAWGDALRGVDGIPVFRFCKSVADRNPIPCVDPVFTSPLRYKARKHRRKRRSCRIEVYTRLK